MHFVLDECISPFIIKSLFLIIYIIIAIDELKNSISSWLMELFKYVLLSKKFNLLTL